MRRLGIWTQLDIVRIFGVIIVVASFIYLVAGLRRTGQNAFVFASGLVHATRSDVAGVRWDEVNHFEVVKKRSVESMLGLPNYGLHRRDGTAMRLTGFLVESRELGRHLDQVLPAR